MLNKWLSFELYCFALILLQKLQLFCFWHLFMLKMCSKHQFATSVQHQLHFGLKGPCGLAERGRAAATGPVTVT